MDEFSEDYLAHHGIKGQKWGIRRTPEELGHKPTGKKKKSAVKEYINKQKEIRAAKKGSAKEEARKLLKDYVRKHPKKLPFYAKVLSKEEVNEIIDNINFDRRLKEIRVQEIEAGWKKVQRTANNIGTLATFLNNSKNLYNNTAEIYNALIRDDDSKKPMTKIGEKKEKDTSTIDAIVRSGDAKKIYEHRNEMTPKQLEDAMKGLKYMEQLKEKTGN